MQLWRKKVLVLIAFTLILGTAVLGYTTEDPYRTLGVGRSASLQEIRRAYKQLAKEWHPDKTSEPDAERKFLEVKQAYELLADSDRRNAFDQHGITDEDSSLFHEHNDYTRYGRFAPDPLEGFFGQHFHFDQDISLFHKLSITSKYYEQTLVPKSAKVPHILMFYADWCFSCMKAAISFKKMIDSLEPLGIILASVNAAHESQLLRKTNVHSLPCIVLVLNGHNYVYKENIYSIHKIIDFIRHKMPYRILENVNDNNLDNFLNGWNDNRVRALVIEPRPQSRLRYLVTAFSYRYNVVFGFVELNTRQAFGIQEKYKLHPSLDSLLIFNEDSSHPVASISMSDIPTQTLNNVISANQYLALPRLSSQEMLEGVCPAEWNRPRKRLCVILVTENIEAHDNARAALRKIALQGGYSPDRIRFTYIYKEKQLDFLNALSNGLTDDTTLQLVTIWRRDTTHIKYEWIQGITLDLTVKGSESESSPIENQNFNQTKQKLDESIQKFLRSSETLSHEAFVKDLLDEHAQGPLSKIFNKILLTVDYLTDNISQEHILPAVSVLFTVAFILGVGYLMSYLVKIEEENIKKKKLKEDSHKTKTSVYIPELKLHELRAEKYNGLVRLLKPGCRSIILLTDFQSRSKLIPGFHKAVWPYRKNKTLMFSHMLIEKGLNWYSEVLRLSLSECRELDINPRNCVGTVLALNGHRKYFCMYHAKHPETNRGARRMLKMTKHLTSSSDDPEAGAFLGLHSESEDSEESDNNSWVLLEENLLDGLCNWLDRLFEGTTHRYYVNYWPDFTTK